MKSHLLLLPLTMAAVLCAAGCGQKGSPDSSRLTTEGEAPSQTAQASEENESQTDAPASASSQVTVQPWWKEHEAKYSETGQLIYEWDVSVPEILIPENPKAQYHINQYLRKNDPTDEKYSFEDSACDDYDYRAASNPEDFPWYAYNYSYEVLKNDGRLVSLKQNCYSFTGGAHGNYFSYLGSYDAEKGRKLELNALSDNPEGLKLALQQSVAEAAAAEGWDSELAQRAMSTDINNFAFLADGIYILYNPYELGSSYAEGGQDFVIPYEKIEEELNSYGKELVLLAAQTPDESQKEEAPADYIFPESNTAFLSGEDLLDAIPSTLRLARNEIFARHGRKFDSPDLQAYFSEKAWYQPTVEANAFDESVLNEFEKRNLALIQTAEKQLKSKEITESGVQLEQDRTYEYDLDGDGTCETICWKALPENESLPFPQPELYINGVLQTAISPELCGSIQFSLLDLKKGDRELELHLSLHGDSDSLNSLSFYRYHDGRLEQIGELVGNVCGGKGVLYRYGSLNASGDGLLTICADTPFGGSSQTFGCFYVDLVYSYDNGTLKEVVKDLYSKRDYNFVTSAFAHDSEFSYYVVASGFTAFTEAGGTTTAFKAMPGQTVCPVAWTLKGDKIYALVMNESGDCGWVEDFSWDTELDSSYYLEVPVWG